MKNEIIGYAVFTADGDFFQFYTLEEANAHGGGEPIPVVKVEEVSK